MAGVLSETTVAAPRTLFLHESVNAVPGPRDACIDAAKVGNATLDQFADALRQSGSMHGAPADPEAFG